MSDARDITDSSRKQYKVILATFRKWLKEVEQEENIQVNKLTQSLLIRMKTMPVKQRIFTPLFVAGITVLLSVGAR